MTERKERLRFVEKGLPEMDEKFKLIKSDMRGFYETEFQKAIRELRKAGL